MMRAAATKTMRLFSGGSLQPSRCHIAVPARQCRRTWPDGPDRLARTVAATCRLVGRLTDAHDEVLYVIRKPEERFARVV